MKTYRIIFSPTGGTAQAAEALTEKWPEPQTIDLSDRALAGDIVLEEDALALIAMPCFGGLAPQLALERLQRIRADHTKCALVAVYGNRACEDTLIQMKDYAEKAGFRVIAAVSAIAEHSILHAFAAGRPDAADRAQLSGFGERILSKAGEAYQEISVPGNRPYKKAGAGMVPKASAACTACGACAGRCPAGAIPPGNPRMTDKNKCIGCMRCVALCPQNARGLNPVMTSLAAAAIRKACAEPKQNELYL